MSVTARSRGKKKLQNQGAPDSNCLESCCTPATDSVISRDGAGAAGSGGEGLEGARRRIALAAVVAAPAGDSTVGRDGPRVDGSRVEELVGTRRCIALPDVVAAPAGDSAVGRKGAHVIVTGGENLEASVRRRVRRSGHGDSGPVAQPASVWCAHSARLVAGSH